MAIPLNRVPGTVLKRARLEIMGRHVMGWRRHAVVGSSPLTFCGYWFARAGEEDISLNEDVTGPVFNCLRCQKIAGGSIGPTRES